MKPIINSMRRHPMGCALLLSVLVGAAGSAPAASWSYRGNLEDGGQPAHGRYDLRLTLIDEFTRAAVVGPVILYRIDVRGGQFATEVDFGIDPTRASLLLRTEVSADGRNFIDVGEPKRVEPNGTAAACWLTQGNAGTSAALDFLGTTDDQPLQFVVNNGLVGRFENSTPGLPNIVLGSALNSLLPGVVSSVLMGGRNSVTTRNIAAGSNATVSGGYGNVAESLGTVAGGQYNHAGPGAFAIGAFNCAGGHDSMAAGYRARVRRSTTPGPIGGADPCDGLQNSGDADGDNGTFVWADDQPADFVSSGARQFLLRAGGGVLFNTNTLVASPDDLVLKARAGGDADVDLRVVSASGKSGSLYLKDSDGAWRISAPNLSGPDFLTVTNGARLTAGGAWVNASSRGLKQDFESLDAQRVLEQVLALPITTWRYRESVEGVHMGPVAEDFHAAFGLGDSPRSIATVDADGVLFAAVQALHKRMLEIGARDSVERRELREENVRLRELGVALQARIAAIEHGCHAPSQEGVCSIK